MVQVQVWFAFFFLCLYWCHFSDFVQCLEEIYYETEILLRRPSIATTYQIRIQDCSLISMIKSLWRTLMDLICCKVDLQAMCDKGVQVIERKQHYFQLYWHRRSLFCCEESAYSRRSSKFHVVFDVVDVIYSCVLLLSLLFFIALLWMFSFFVTSFRLLL